MRGNRESTPTPIERADMGRILYSMAGEGRGHATRVRTVVESLRDRHDILLYAPGDAYDLLADGVGDGGYRLRSLPGLRFGYDARGRLSPSRTAVQAARYLAALPRLVRRLAAEIEREAPDLVITDFEPALARAARRVGVPFVSLDHQHFLVVSDFASLPATLRTHARVMRGVVSLYYSGQAATIVSSFFHPPPRRGFDAVTRVGVLLRENVRAARPTREGHVVAYVRRDASLSLLDALASCGRPVRVYGLGEQPSRGALTFRAIDGQRFVDDLASSEALVSTAGNQLLGEALYLGKPVLALPETGNREQVIHAHYLESSGCGLRAEMRTVDTATVRGFLDRLEVYRARIRPEQVIGNDAALAALDPWLASPNVSNRTASSRDAKPTLAPDNGRSPSTSPPAKEPVA